MSKLPINLMHRLVINVLMVLWMQLMRGSDFALDYTFVIMIIPTKDASESITHSKFSIYCS